MRPPSLSSIILQCSARQDQITLSNNIFSELGHLDLELAKIPSGSQYNDTIGYDILGYLTVSTGYHL
jgi:hypothetical protein